MNRRNKGFSLMEMAVAMSVIGVLTAVASMFVKDNIDLWLTVNYHGENVSQGRMAVERMAREIRQIKDCYSLYAAAAENISFTDINGVSIRYYRNSADNTLIREADGSGSVMAAGVVALAFQYYNSAHQVPAALKINPECTDAVSVEISLRIRTGSKEKMFKTEVSFRNI